MKFVAILLCLLLVLPMVVAIQPKSNDIKKDGVSSASDKPVEKTIIGSKKISKFPGNNKARLAKAVINNVHNDESNIAQVKAKVIQKIQPKTINSKVKVEKKPGKELGSRVKLESIVMTKPLFGKSFDKENLGTK